jgi:hypothetical protein
MGDWTKNPVPTPVRIVLLVLSVGTAVFCGLIEDAGYKSSSGGGANEPRVDRSLAIQVAVVGPTGAPVARVRVLATPTELPGVAPLSDAGPGNWAPMECETDARGACALVPFPPEGAAPAYRLQTGGEWLVRRPPTVRLRDTVTLELERSSTVEDERPAR